VRALGAGRVEQRSNGGYWAQGVCRGQSSNREAPEVCEGARGIEGRAAAEKRLESGKGKEYGEGKEYGVDKKHEDYS
jgi:hypothetical protein